jgi:hypothetical protein
MTKGGPAGVHASDQVFKIRATAQSRTRRTSVPVPTWVMLHADGSAAVSYGSGEALTHFHSIAECLGFHELLSGDLEPVD